MYTSDSFIKKILATEILDSRGNPTLQVSVETRSGHRGVAAVPSGASTGEHEAVELRDNDSKRYGGKGVLKALANVTGPIAQALANHSVLDQRACDEVMIRADGTANKSKFGANAILGVSLAISKAAATFHSQDLYRQIAKQQSYLLPCPMMNVLNGGAHADNSIDFQEFMIRPVGAHSFAEKIRFGSEIFHTLKALLKREGHVTAVGDEGGFAPNLKDHNQALDYLMRAIDLSGFTGKVSLALDCAASEFYLPDNKVYKEKKLGALGKTRTAAQQVDYLVSLCEKYPIDSIEDGMDQNDWEGWKLLTEKLGKRVQIVGDDLFVTNEKFLQKGIDLGIANAILIKPNQIGTLTETLDTMALAKKHGYKCILSHRSGETEDTTIADIAVATNCGQIKTGSLCRSDRVAKYNRLLTIEQQLKTP